MVKGCVDIMFDMVDTASLLLKNINGQLISSEIFQGERKKFACNIIAHASFLLRVKKNHKKHL